MQLTVTKVLSSFTLFGYGGDFLPTPDQHHRTYQKELLHGLEANDWPTSTQGVEEIVAVRGKANRWRSRRHRGFPWCTRTGRICNFHIHNQDYCTYWILHS